MKLTFKQVVTITIEPKHQEGQTAEEFAKEDGRAMQKYAEEKIHNAVIGAWQHNAVVTKVKVTKG